MSWRIATIINTVEINKRCARALFNADKSLYNETWSSADDVAYNGKIQFNSDHMEHMDILKEENIQNVLLKHKVAGDICFGSLEGDNLGSFWGYRFDGEGNVRYLFGDLEWKEISKEKK